MLRLILFFNVDCHLKLVNNFSNKEEKLIKILKEEI